jgi:hypothetical protein
MPFLLLSTKLASAGMRLLKDAPRRAGASTQEDSCTSRWRGSIVMPPIAVSWLPSIRGRTIGSVKTASKLDEMVSSSAIATFPPTTWVRAMPEERVVGPHRKMARPKPRGDGVVGRGRAAAIGARRGVMRRMVTRPYKTLPVGVGWDQCFF